VVTDVDAVLEVPWLASDREPAPDGTGGSASGVQQVRQAETRRRANGAVIDTQAATPSGGRWRARIATVVVVVMVLAGIWIVASRTTSPDQIAADARPPRPRTLLAKVERRELVDAAPVEGTVRYAALINFTVSGFDGPMVVSRPPTAVNSPVSEGDVPIWVSGQPVIVLQGSVPSFRELALGARGDDVVQLQDALRRLGYFISPRETAEFGRTTEAAVRKLHTDRGLPVPEHVVDAGAQDSGTDPAGGGSGLPTPPSAPSREAFLPQNQVFFVPTLPTVLIKRGASLGQAVPSDGPLLTVAAGAPEVQAKLTNVADKSRVKRGQKVELVNDANGDRWSGLVSKIDQSSDSENGDAASVALVVGGPIPLTSRTNGLDVRGVIRLQESKGMQLVVPVAAVYSDAAGRTYVEVHAAGRTRRVSVELSAEVEGFVAVNPSAGLKAGTLVAIGRRR